MLHLTRVSDTLVFSRHRPRRAIFLHVARNHALLTGLIITLTIAFSALRYAPWVVGIWLVCYWIYKLGRPFVFATPELEHSNKLSTREWWRFVLIMLSATFLIWYVYLYTEYVKDNGLSNTIWLIYILPIFITIQYSENRLIFVSVLASIASLACISINYAVAIAHAITANVLYAIVTDALWLTLISFMLYVLVRIINDRSANLRLLHDLGNELVGIPAADDEPALFQTIAGKIAQQFPYSHIFIFLFVTVQKI